MLVNSHSYYSLRYGVLSPKEWLAFFESEPWTTMAITDINNTSACMTVLYLLRNHAKKRAVIGVDFRNGITPCYVHWLKIGKAFARSMITYQNISIESSAFHRALQSQHLKTPGSFIL